MARLLHQALAAASICQVHRGVLKDGREVIIKVSFLRRAPSPVVIVVVVVVWQIKHDGIDDTMAADLAMIPIADSTIGLVFPDVKLGFLADIWKESVRQELDFRNEGHNRERLAKVLSAAGHDGRVSGLHRIIARATASDARGAWFCFRSAFREWCGA
jgi:aarF domain-containing kinase